MASELRELLVPDVASQFARACPSCGVQIYYRALDTLRRAERKGSRCLACCHQRQAGLSEKIRAAYNKGLTNREIAAVVGCTHRTVGYRLREMGLVSHLLRGTPPERVDNDHSRCRRCGEVQPNDQFPFVYGRADGRRLSTCRACRAADARRSLGASPESYFNARQGRLKNGERGRRPSRQSISYNLPDGYLAALWHWQNGLCFYTDKPMKMGLGVGRDPYGVSIDRVDPSRGYEEGNVVLACARVNSVKNDLTPAEMAEWIPSWFERVEMRLPQVVAEVRPAEDNWPRNARGGRLPGWIVKHRQRMAALTEASEVVR